MQNSFVQVYATSISITSLAKRKRFAISPLPVFKKVQYVCDGMEVFSSLSGVSQFLFIAWRVFEFFESVRVRFFTRR